MSLLTRFFCLERRRRMFHVATVVVFDFSECLREFNDDFLIVLYYFVGIFFCINRACIDFSIKPRLIILF